jgi:hypothetical protein
MDQRYTIDERSGCAAVIDTFYPNSCPGLHSDLPHVLFYMDIPRKNNGDDEDPNRRAEVLTILRERAFYYNSRNLYTQEDCNRLFDELIAFESKFKTAFPQVRDLDVRFNG